MKLKSQISEVGVAEQGWGECGKNEGEYNPHSSVITLPGNQGFLDLATVMFPRMKKKKRRRRRRKSTFIKFGEDEFTTDDLLYAK